MVISIYWGCFDPHMTLLKYWHPFCASLQWYIYWIFHTFRRDIAIFLDAKSAPSTINASADYRTSSKNKQDFMKKHEVSCWGTIMKSEWSLWIYTSEQQKKRFSGYSMIIYSEKYLYPQSVLFSIYRVWIGRRLFIFKASCQFVNMHSKLTVSSQEK